MRTRSLSIGLLLLLLWSGYGRADPAIGEPSSGDARALAKERSRRAELRYKLGRYDEAAAGYREAYRIYPVPALLFNMGQCQLRLGHDAAAIPLLERYLRDQPDARNRALVESLIAEARGRDRAARRQALLVRRDPAAGAPALATSRPRPAERSSERFYQTWWFWAAAGAFVGAGGTYLILSNDGGGGTLAPVPDGHR